MYSAYKLNKHSDNMQPWCTPFPVLNQSVVQNQVLTVASCPAYRFLRRFLRRQVVWYFHLFKNFPQFVEIHTVKGFSIVNEAEADIFLELSCFFYGPMDVGNLVSCSSAFSKSRLNIWNFSVHLNLLKPLLKNFKHCAFIMYFNTTYALNLIRLLDVYVYMCAYLYICVLYLLLNVCFSICYCFPYD